MRVLAAMGLALALLLPVGCDKVGDQGPAEGPCAEGDRTCASDTEFQECEEGEWSEPLRCPPEGDPPVEITTYCNDGGLCAP